MTRILADLPDDDIKWLDARAAVQGKSRASVLREAVSAYKAETAAAESRLNELGNPRGCATFHDETVAQGAVVACVHLRSVSGQFCPIGYANTKRADREGPLLIVEMIMSRQILRDRVRGFKGLGRWWFMRPGKAQEIAAAPLPDRLCLIARLRPVGRP